MSKRKMVPLIVMFIVATGFFAGWWYLNLGLQTGPLKEQVLQDIRMSVSLDEENSQWIRDYTTDLPLYSSTIAYRVLNYGNGTASDVQYAIYVDDDLFSQDTIPALSSYTSYRGNFSIQMMCGDQRQICLTASCGDSVDAHSLILKATLPRSPFSAEIMKLYITPNDSIVKSVVTEILESKPSLVPDWTAIRDWVSENIQHKDDDTVHDVSDYWQLPRETISLGTGDCEDYSILLCSLYRAVGFSVDEVYLVLGEDAEGYGHTWIRIYVETLGWRVVDPQTDSNEIKIFVDIDSLGYTEECIFNDTYFEYCV